MNQSGEAKAPDAKDFLAAINAIAASLNWRVQSFNREDEVVAAAALDQDPFFEQVIWIYDTKRVFVRCLLVGRDLVPAERMTAIIELCAHINDGLVFGCAEYSFSDRTFMLRDSTSLEYGTPHSVLNDLSRRVFNLGARYGVVVAAVIAGKPVAEAMGQA